MKTRTMVAAAAIAVSLAGGAVGGALLFTPQLSGAQEATTSTTTDPGAPGPGRGFAFGGPGLGVAATAIGISESDLRRALEGGKTIAEVATDHGVDVQKVIDAMVADAKTKLEKLQAGLPDRIAAVVNGTAPLGRPGGRGPGHVVGPGLDAAATALGMSEAELRTALRDGKSVADVAKEQGVDLQKVIDAAVAAATKRIDQAVTDGKLDSDAATKLKAGLTDRVTALVNGQRPAGGPGFGPGRGHWGGRARGAGAGSTSTQGASYTN